MEELQEEPDDTDSEGESDSTVSLEPTPQFNDELEFLRSVKLAIGSDSKEFDEFLQSWKDHYRQRAHIDNEVQSKTRLLLREHPQLVADFEAFLSAEHEISVPVQKLSLAVECEVAARFVRKVMVEYIYDNGRYRSFLEILNVYRTGRKNRTQTCKEVEELFHDKPDLIAEFFSIVDVNAIFQARPNRPFVKLKKSCIPALLHLAVLGLGICIGFYLA